MALSIKLYDVFNDPEFFENLVQNFFERGREMSILMLTIPGASCFGIGYRAGALER